MIRVYFTLDGSNIEVTDSEYESQAKAEFENARMEGNRDARMFLVTDGTEDFTAVHAVLEGTL